MKNLTLLLKNMLSICVVLIGFETIHGQCPFNSEPNIAVQTEAFSTITILEGSSTTLNSPIVGASYQWMLDGNPISGATNSSLSITNFKETDVGDYALNVDGVTLINTVTLNILNTSISDYDRDRMALIDLYNSTGGTSWTRNSNWLTGDISTWEGVTVRNCRVTRISLPDNNLVGTTPASFRNLTALERLNLRGNSISGVLDISNMSSLTILYAFGNQLTDVNFGSITTLQRVQIQNNPFTPGKTIDLSGMRELIDFRASNLGLHNVIVSGVYDNLRYFIIGDNNISGTLDISGMPKLNLCYAHNNQFSDFNFGIHPELSRFYFYNNPIAPGKTMDISSMRNLLDFRVHGLGLRDLIVSGTYDKMLYFLIQDNQLRGTLDISKMPNINLCYAHNNQFNDFRLGSHPELGRLYLYDNPLAPGKTMDISSMRNLLDFRVHGLGLSNLIVSGTYDKMLYFLIQDNELNGTLDISRMPNINLCYAHNNQFTDFSLGSHPELGRLYFYNNPLAAGKTMDISSMRNLLDFRVQGLGLEGLTLSGSYDKMLYFLIQDNELPGTLDLSLMPNLKVAYAHNNNYTDVLLNSSVFGIDRQLGNLRLDNNNLHFDDLIPFSSLFGAFNFRYAPQKNVPTLVSGTNVAVNVGGGTVYDWTPFGPNSNSVPITVSGVYFCKISNPIVPELTIESDPVNLIGSSISDIKKSITKKLTSEMSFTAVNPVKVGIPIKIRMHTSEQTELNFIIYTIQGKKLKSFNRTIGKGISEIELDSNGLPQGVYILSTEEGGKEQSAKIVIQ